MATPLPMATRQKIISSRASGKSLREISRELSISYATVQQLCKRYKLDPDSGLLPRYGACGKVRRDGTDLVYRAVRCMKCWHPSWGAAKIRCELLRLRPTLKIPQVRMLQKWFHWNGQIPVPSELQLPDSRWAKSVHEGWQIDAKEGISILGPQKQSWLNIVDECSSAVIDTGVFPPQKDHGSTLESDSGAAY